MATLNNFFLHYQTKAAFEIDKKAGKISDLSISFIKDVKEIYTHGIFYQCSMDSKIIEQRIQAIIVQDINGVATDKVVSQAVVRSAIEKVLKSLSESEVKIESEIKKVSDKVNSIETVLVPEIKAYTVNGKTISTNPNLSKEDIGLGSVTNDAQVKRSEMGAISGVATLNEIGKVPSTQLPSYVDDVLEFENKTAFPKTGEAGKIYIAKDSNLTYRWGGTQYVEISQSLALGETSSTAFSGERGKKLEEAIKIHFENKSNPHSITKDQLGLGKVDNTSDLEKPISTIQQAVIDAVKKELSEKIATEIARSISEEKKINSELGIINGDAAGSIKKGDKDTLEVAKKFASNLFTWYEGN